MENDKKGEKLPSGLSPIEDGQITIRPFKLKNDKGEMPFARGQGVSLAGWQFRVEIILKNGNMVLKPMGKILAIKQANVAT